MMLPADMSLVLSPEFKPFVEIYAKDEEIFFKDFAAAFSKVIYSLSLPLSMTLTLIDIISKASRIGCEIS
jgi:catalase (peroxidase I)